MKEVKEIYKNSESIVIYFDQFGKVICTLSYTIIKLHL